MARSDDEQRIGTEVDTYEIVALLGAGGMGAVYRGVHTWTRREVAIKFLHRHVSRNDQNVRRFMKEARAAVALHHPNVVDVLDMGRDENGDVYLVMELLHGESLRGLLTRRGALRLDEALQLMLPLLSALQSSHDAGIVHRDLKPDNIFLAEQGGVIVPKVLDYGVAKVTEPELGSAPGTATGALLGTPRYMSPEQANGQLDAGPAIDIWAMGMMLYEMLTGTLPFDDCTSLPALLLRLVMEDVPSIQQRAPHVEPAVAAVVERALQRDVALRIPSMAEFGAALRRASGEQPADDSASALGPVARTRERAMAATVAVERHEHVSYGPVERRAFTHVRGLLRRRSVALLSFFVLGGAAVAGVRLRASQREDSPVEVRAAVPGLVVPTRAGEHGPGRTAETPADTVSSEAATAPYGLNEVHGSDEVQRKNASANGKPVEDQAEQDPQPSLAKLPAGSKRRIPKDASSAAGRTTPAKVPAAFHAPGADHADQTAPAATAPAAIAPAAIAPAATAPASTAPASTAPGSRSAPRATDLPPALIDEF